MLRTKCTLLFTVTCWIAGCGNVKKKDKSKTARTVLRLSRMALPPCSVKSLCGNLKKGKDSPSWFGALEGVEGECRHPSESWIGLDATGWEIRPVRHLGRSMVL